MRRWLLVALLVAAACAPRENLEGATVLWQSTDGKDRVVRAGPCVKTQTYDDYAYAWRTTATDCDASTSSP